MSQLTEADERKKLAEGIIQAEQRGGEELPRATEIINKVAATTGISKEEIQQASRELSERAFEDDERVQQAVGEAAPYLDFNPRKVKKFINNFRLQALIAQKRGLLGPTGINVGSLAKAVVISMRWPELASSMMKDGSTCQKLRHVFVAQEQLRVMESTETGDQSEMLTARNALQKLKAKCLSRFINADDLNRLLSSMDDVEIGRFARCFNLPASER